MYHLYYRMHSLILEMVANPAFDSVIPNITTAAAAPEKLKAEFTNPLYDENESLSKSFVVVCEDLLLSNQA